jgi:uncharacterized coiled-coil DUF342 family protein
MINNDFDPYEIIIQLQQQVAQLHANQESLIKAINHQGQALGALHNSNIKNFEYIEDINRRLNDLTIKIVEETNKKSP